MFYISGHEPLRVMTRYIPDCGLVSWREITHMRCTTRDCASSEAIATVVHSNRELVANIGMTEIISKDL